MTVYLATALLVLLCVVASELVWRTGLFTSARYWLTMAVVMAAQVVVDGVLTDLPGPVVRYDPSVLVGWRFPWDIPVEDFVFGFAMCTWTLLVWVRLRSRTGAAEQSADPRWGGALPTVHPPALEHREHQLRTAVQAELDGAHLTRLRGPEAAVMRAALGAAVADGKLLRPRLMCATHDLLGGSAAAAVAPVAAAIELLHTAFVIHDDVIDRDEVRRGGPSAAAQIHASARARGATPSSAAAYGAAGAVLTGDLALCAALRAVAMAPVGDEVRHRLLDLVDEALAVSAAGELADVRGSWQPGSLTIEESLAIAEHKTAVYTFCLPLAAGAVLAGAPDDLVAPLVEVGRHLGIAYQLHDDIDGVFGDPLTTGKSCLGDLREGKSTPLVAHLRGTRHWEAVSHHIGDPGLGEREAAAVRQALVSGGSLDFVSGQARHHLDSAAALAEAAALPTPLVAFLFAGAAGRQRVGAA